MRRRREKRRNQVRKVRWSWREEGRKTKKGKIVHKRGEKGNEQSRRKRAEWSCWTRQRRTRTQQARKSEDQGCSAPLISLQLKATLLPPIWLHST